MALLCSLLTVGTNKCLKHYGFTHESHIDALIESPLQWSTKPIFYSISHVALPLTVYIATRWCCVVQLEGAASATDLCLDGWRAGTRSLPYCCSFL